MKDIKTKIAFFLLLLFSIPFFLRLYHLQIKKSEYYSALSLGQHLTMHESIGERGEIFFNDGKTPLAQTATKYIAYIFWNKINKSDKKDKILNFLSLNLNEDKQSLINELKGNLVVKKIISKKVYKTLSNANQKGVYTDIIQGRIYPQKTLASRIVGFVNEKGEGQYGLEGYFNSLLRGEVFLRQKLSSPFGFLIDELKNDFLDQKNKGADIVLTINYNIQYFAEKALQESIKEWEADAGEVIVEQPQTGKILAMAIYPAFDPNNFQKAKNISIFINPCAQKLFEPGSIFKPITFAGAIEEGLISATTTYTDKGFVNLGGPPIYNFQKRVWGKQTMTDVLEESINTGAVFVEQKLGEKKFLKFLKKFGFFEPTNIELQGEVFSKNETLWHGYPRDIATASFGQGVEVTSLQIIRAFGAIANGGKLIDPFLVEKIIKNHRLVKQNHPKIRRLVISKKTSNILSKMLVSVVENGSARRAKIPGYLIAAKTGTAQVPLKSGGYSPDKTIHTFIGYFPADDPKFLIFVKLENPKKALISGYSTAPLFKKIAEYIIHLYQIPPQVPENTSL